MLDGGHDDDRQDLDKFLSKDLRLIDNMAQIGDDYIVYGNSFSSLFMPFDRYLICPSCGTNYSAERVRYRFELPDTRFSGHCAKCRKHTVFRVEDRKSWDRSRMKIVRWNPKNIRIKYNKISGKIRYYLRMDHDLFRQLNSGDPFYINDTPLPILKWASQARAGTHNVYFGFDPREIYHMRETNLAGLPIVGWGIPPLLPNLRLAYYIQLLRRYDEAIALDFIIPFRVMYPKASMPAGTAMDPILMGNLAKYKGHLQEMVRNKRLDPTNIQISPVEIGYQMIGGEANALAPKESLQMATTELLDSMGVPAELYRGTLSIQAFPVALRLFEKTWGNLVTNYNQYTAWVVESIARYYGYGDLTGSLRSVTLADDIENKAILMEASAAQDISKSTAYQTIGYDYLDEQQKIIEEQTEVMKLQEEAMADQSAQEAEGETPPGGQPGATPGDVHEQARQMAYTFVVETPETVRRSELIKVKRSNPTLHALVIQEMDALRQQYATQGQAMMIEQEKMASARNTPSPFALKAFITEQLLDYSRRDMRRLACRVHAGDKVASDAFHFVFAHQRGFDPRSYPSLAGLSRNGRLPARR